MKATATQLRKTLFTTLDKVIDGEPVEIDYKGKKIQIQAVPGGSKLERMVRRDAIVGDPDFTETSREILAEMEAEWEEDWKDI